MSLNSSSLTQAIKAGLLSLPIVGDLENRTYGDVMTSAQESAMEDNIKVYAEEIINHIIANAKVTVAMTTHTHSGVTTGAGVSGPPVPGTSEAGSSTSVPPGGIT